VNRSRTATFARSLLDPGEFAQRYGLRGFLFFVAVAAALHLII
jgi:hypothetical protein